MTSAIIPTEGKYVELAATNKGRLFRKQILQMDSAFLHPKNPKMKVKIDKTFAERLVDNFNKGVGGIVQFPFVDDQNRHVEAPERNRGEVVGLSYDDKGVWATIDVRRDADTIGETVLGASAFLDLDYQDKVEGKHHGPTLLHVAATNRPYLTQLAPYEALSLSDISDDEELVVLSQITESETPMDLEDLLAELKTTHGIDVEALQAQAAAAAEAPPAPQNDMSELVAALSGVLSAADPNLVSLSDSDEDITIEDVAQGIIELSRNYETVSTRLESIEAEAAEAEVDRLVDEGKILPRQREAMLRLRLSDVDTFNELVPEEAIVALSAEHGFTTHESSSVESAAAEVGRYLNAKGSTAPIPAASTS